jgi:hypothetical protein
MHNSKVLDDEVESRLDTVGGALLAGSGFENELTEPGFDTDASEED